MQAKFWNEAIQLCEFDQLLTIPAPYIGHFTWTHMLIPIPLIDGSTFLGVG